MRRQKFDQSEGAAGSAVSDTPEVENTKVVETTEFGSKKSATFSIKVKSDEKGEDGKEKILYENEEESFTYEQVDGFINMLRHAGAKLDDSQMEFLGAALVSKDAEGNETEDSKATGEATKSVVKLYNAKLKADAKSSAYQSLVNKYKPLEGEKKESAQARTIANFIKLAGVSKEAAIAALIQHKVLPEDYTVADFDSTPLRRTKGDSDE